MSGVESCFAAFQFRYEHDGWDFERCLRGLVGDLSRQVPPLRRRPSGPPERSRGSSRS